MQHAAVPPPAAHVSKIDLSDTQKGTTQRYWVHLVNNKLGFPMRVPVMVARGAYDGPVLGLTAAIHGNELNGIPVIQRCFEELDPTTLHGTVVGVLAVNVPGLLLEQRAFNDGADLNRIAPGDPKGTGAQVYMYRFVHRILQNFELHIDLHTASFGRVNTHYVRADMKNEKTARMARLQSPEIIVHNPPSDKTLRGAAAEFGIHSVTVECRDPLRFQGGVIEHALDGIQNVMVDEGMVPEGAVSCPITDTVLCSSSAWTYTDEGGFLWVFPTSGKRVKKGDKVAEVRTVFGEVTRTYHAPDDAIVVGKSHNPLNQTGSRIIHYGFEPQAIPCITDDEPGASSARFLA